MTKQQSFKKSLAAKELHKHPFVVPILTLLVLLFATMIGTVLFGAQAVGPTDSHVVQLTVDGDKQAVPTRASTVKDFLERAEVQINEGDVVEPDQNTLIDANDFRINIYRARPVTIFDGEKRIQALSAATTARSVAAQTGIAVYPEDNLDTQVSNDILKDQVLGEKIVITRAIPTNLNLYGTPITLRTHAKTVGELLKEKNISLNTGDTVQPAPDQPVTANIQVFVTRFGTQIATSEEPIPMEEEIVEDPSLSFGTQALRQAGSPGKKLVTYQLDLQNGIEVGRRVIQEVRVTEPVKQITARGKAVSIPADKEAIMRAAGIVESDFPYAQFIINHENGLWCATRWQGQNTCPPYYAEKYPGAETNTSTGYGLCQSTPAIKMETSGADWRTNPVTQMKWCHNYAQRRHGSWAGAYNYWLANRNW